VRRFLLVGGALVLAASVAWILGSELATRERMRRPAVDGLALRTLVAARGPVRLWLAYPHQNLASFAGGAGELEEWLSAAGGELGGAVPKLPRVGPWPFLPARELALAWNPDDRGLLAVAEVYPALAPVLRLAGWLAGNPWLSGGRVRVAGREAQVGWQGSAWILSAGVPLPGPVSTAPREEPAIALVELDRDLSEWLPAGRHRLARWPDGELRLESEVGGAETALADVTAWAAATEADLTFVTAGQREEEAEVPEAHAA